MGQDEEGQVSVRGLVSHVRNLLRTSERGLCKYVCMSGSINYFTRVSLYNKASWNKDKNGTSIHFFSVD